jgi:SHS2 domain-containing protein
MGPAAREAEWSHFPHEADVGVRGVGPTPEVAFEQAALAMTAAIVDPTSVRPEQRVAIACNAPDIELLLAEWLNALVYEMATRRMLFGRFEVRIRGTKLTAQAWGEPVEINRHQPSAEVKGATLSELKVRAQPNGSWLAQCIVDV